MGLSLLQVILYEQQSYALLVTIWDPTALEVMLKISVPPLTVEGTAWHSDRTWTK